MPETYIQNLTHFTTFLTAYTHTLLALRNLYPRATFLTARFHNTAIFQNRHPAVCAWITDAIAAVRTELLKGTVTRMVVAIYHAADSRRVNVMERFVIDVASFLQVGKADWETDVQFAPEPEVVDDDGRGKGNEKAKTPQLDASTDPNLSEQFRAALTLLHTRCAQLAPLPRDCSFNIAIELKDEVDPPVGHPQPWIPVEPRLQRSSKGLNFRDRPIRSDRPSWDATQEGGDGELEKEGKDLGGVKVTPIRAVQAGVLRFETWMEESKAKYEMAAREPDTVDSSRDF
ncbi:DNA-binding protein [Mytilinidion resinicola]|uniref:DNA-binding protein n=1 Tax=Mytilinidion resinicola TaxID=574789 RepID=A0A6A6YY31_9PEZI|nr:DNA-binding protein [Mytilinidion resinicola]KAF2813458.1 DNA-binding protein [Mytilinidion resinicola]